MAVEPIFESYGNKLIGVPNNEESGGSGGHVIENSSGTDLPQEDTLQFTDSHVTDDSVNGRTVVETFKAVTEAEYSSETEDGAYIITDGDGATIGPASEDYVEVDVTTSMTYGDALALLFNDVDLTKVTENSYINMLGFVFYLTNNETGNYDFTSLNGNSSKAEMFVINNYNNALKYYVYNLYTQQRTDKSSDNIWTNGKIKLYYGNKKAIVDLQTTANRCVTSDGGTVQQALNAMPLEVVEKTATTDANGRFLLGSANRYFACVPKTSASTCTISGYFTNIYNITYANTDKPNTELTMMCLRMKS